MNRKMQLQKDADVLNKNGKQIGLLERVVLNPETGVVTDLVVRTGTFLDRKERVVSMDMVVEASEHLVILRDDKDGLDSLHPLKRSGSSQISRSQIIPLLMCRQLFMATLVASH